MRCEHYENTEVMADLGRAVVDQLIGFVNKGRDTELRETRGAASHIVATVRGFTTCEPEDIGGPTEGDYIQLAGENHATVCEVLGEMAPDCWEVLDEQGESFYISRFALKDTEERRAWQLANVFAYSP